MVEELARSLGDVGMFLSIKALFPRHAHHRIPEFFCYDSVTSILRTGRLCKARRAISLDFWQVGEQEITPQWTVCCTCFNGSYSGSRGAIWRANAKITPCSHPP